MEIVLEVPDKDAARVLELVRGIKRVKIKSPRLPAVPNEELVAELREAGQQLARIRQGETVGRAAHELLNEL